MGRAGDPGMGVGREGGEERGNLGMGVRREGGGEERKAERGRLGPVVGVSGIGISIDEGPTDVDSMRGYYSRVGVSAISNAIKRCRCAELLREVLVEDDIYSLMCNDR